MGLITTIWRRITEIQLRTLHNPTHIEVPEKLIDTLILEYNELSGSNRSSSIVDLEDYFGNIKLTVALRDTDDIKILEEVNAYS